MFTTKQKFKFSKLDLSSNLFCASFIVFNRTEEDKIIFYQLLRVSLKIEKSLVPGNCFQYICLCVFSKNCNFDKIFINLSTALEVTEKLTK